MHIVLVSSGCVRSAFAHTTIATACQPVAGSRQNNDHNAKRICLALGGIAGVSRPWFSYFCEMGSLVNPVIPESEYVITVTRASGPGGQHVNKASTAVILKFDIEASSLPEKVKQRILKLKDNRLTSDGILIIRSENFRSQKRNKEAAIARLEEIVQAASKVRKKRVPTRPSKSSIENRLQEKARRSETKSFRQKPVK